jgi:tripeptidyl-peptidase-1
MWALRIFLLTACAAALPSALRHTILHERRQHGEYSSKVRIHKDAILPLRIGLSQQNLHLGYELLMDVSDPASNNYGKYRSSEDVHKIFEPSAEAVDAVTSWLRGEGVDAADIVHSANKGWIAVDLPARRVERMLRTEYYEYGSPGTDRVLIGCDSYHLPAHVSQHVDLIKPAVVRVKAQR